MHLDKQSSTELWSKFAVGELTSFRKIPQIVVFLQDGPARNNIFGEVRGEKASTVTRSFDVKLAYAGKEEPGSQVAWSKPGSCQSPNGGTQILQLLPSTCGAEVHSELRHPRQAS